MNINKSLRPKTIWWLLLALALVVGWFCGSYFLTVNKWASLPEWLMVVSTVLAFFAALASAISANSGNEIAKKVFAHEQKRDLYNEISYLNNIVIANPEFINTDYIHKYTLINSWREETILSQKARTYYLYSQSIYTFIKKVYFYEKKDWQKTIDFIGKHFDNVDSLIDLHSTNWFDSIIYENDDDAMGVQSGAYRNADAILAQNIENKITNLHLFKLGVINLLSKEVFLWDDAKEEKFFKNGGHNYEYPEIEKQLIAVSDEAAGRGWKYRTFKAVSVEPIEIRVLVESLKERRKFG